MTDDEVQAAKDKLDHMERRLALQQVYEWTKTGHINLSEFRALIAHVMTPVGEDVEAWCALHNKRVVDIYSTGQPG